MGRSQATKHTGQPKANEAAAKRRLIPLKQAIYIVVAFGMLVASVMLFFVEPELSRPFFDQPFNIYRVSVMALAIIFLLLASTNGWLRTRDITEPSRTVKLTRILEWAIPALALVFLLIHLICKNI